jgi:hypothetical protein
MPPKRIIKDVDSYAIVRSSFGSWACDRICLLSNLHRVNDDLQHYADR